MNRLAVWVAQTAMSVTVPRALAQATASPLTEIEDGAWLDPDIAAHPLVAMNVILVSKAWGGASWFNARELLRHPMRSPCIL